MSSLTRGKNNSNRINNSNQRTAYATTFTTSSTNASALISNRKQAMEMIPVAITRAKYPGKRSAAARKRKLVSGFELLINCIRFVVATLAVKLNTKTRSATCLGENPVSRSQRRIVPDVLAVTAGENHTPVVFVVFIKARNLLFH